MSEAQAAATNLIAELRQLEEQLDEVRKTLEAQREQLRRRRLAMPAAIINNLEMLKQDFKRLENNVLEEQTELRQLRALSEMSTRITNSLNVDTVLGETMELVIVLTNAERGYIVLSNEETGELEFRISSESGLMGRAMESGDRPQISMTVVNEVMSTGAPLLADNAYQDERLSENQSIINFTLRSVLCVPLRYKDRVTGVVYVDNRLVAGIFTERELKLMMAFANTAAVAIANARMYMRAEQILAEITQVKELMDNIFSSVGSGIIAIDSNDLVHTFNRAAGEILDLRPEVAVGFDVAQVMKNAALELEDHLAHVKQNDADHSLELSAELPGRGQVALALSLSPLKDSNDMTQGVAMVMDDVTHLHEHETTINAMKRILPEGMVDQINEIANIEMGGLRREVTCLFANVRPWVTLPDVAPSEKLRILNQYQAIATACIHECGGIIDKYMGNEVMALFNTQLNPDARHAQMALECGLLMRERFVDLYREMNINPDPHYYIIGMFTGVATLGNVGSFQRREFTALGNSINTAKRIQENAARGTITIVQQTLDHILANQDGGCSYDLRPRDPISGKGLSVAMPAYEVSRSA
ncbi:MAG: GAF domain-containing protein [Chloroflexota bacterium]|nr:GAF domain-containing protein [Chloroflexota bacterium]MDE2910064.1 GAF domain-containing protein [Chloroflexota bacterium]